MILKKKFNYVVTNMAYNENALLKYLRKNVFKCGVKL